MNLHLRSKAARALALLAIVYFGGEFALGEAATSEKPPSQLRFCAQHCISYRWDGAQYLNSTVIPGRVGWTSVLTIESFKRESIILHRVDTEAGQPVFSVTMTGQFSPAGNSIVNTAMNGGTGYWQLVWGSALDTIPGEDGPEQRRLVADAAARHVEQAPATPTGSETHTASVFQMTPDSAAVRAPVPTAIANRLVICEYDGCDPLGHGTSLWTFNGNAGHGVSGDAQGIQMNLTVDRFDSGGVVIKRADVGPTRGLVVVYTGNLDGDRIVGTMSVNWPGHPTASQVAPWSAQPALRSTPRRINLTGVWQTYFGLTDRRGRTLRYRIEDTGDRLRCWGGLSNNGTPNPVGEDDAPLWEGHFISDTVISLRYRGPNATATDSQWIEGKEYLDDPDHLMSLDPVASSLIRSAWHSNDIPCDKGNSYRVTENWAYLRGAAAIANKDYALSACWLHAAATLGHIKSQGLLASQLYDGRGVVRDYAQAFAWAKSAAAQKDLLGETLLASMYKDGNGTAADASLARYWSTRAANERSDQLWSMLDTKTPSGFTPRQVIGAAFAGFNAVMDSISEDGRRFDCASGNDPSACRR